MLSTWITLWILAMLITAFATSIGSVRTQLFMWQSCRKYWLTNWLMWGPNDSSESSVTPRSRIVDDFWMTDPVNDTWSLLSWCWHQWNFSNGNDYGNGNKWPDVNGNGNGNDGNFKNGNIIKTEMKTFKTYRNGNDKKHKWCALADMQCQRIVAFLNLYLRCTSVPR